LLVLANFSEEEQAVPGHRIEALGFSGSLVDHLSGEIFHSGKDLQLKGYQVMWVEES
jgi:hypothetical protein